MKLKQALSILSKIELSKSSSQYDNLLINEDGITFIGETGKLFLKMGVVIDPHDDNIQFYGKVNRKFFIDAMKSSNSSLLESDDSLEFLNFDFKYGEPIYCELTKENIRLCSLCNKKEIRESLTGVYFGEHIVATDAIILRKLDTHFFKDSPFLVKAKDLQMLPEGKYAISFDDKREVVKFDGHGFSYETCLIQSKFPNYDIYFQNISDTVLKVLKEDLVDALKKISVVCKDNGLTKLQVVGGKVTLSAELKNNEEKQIEIVINGTINSQDLEIGFSCFLFLKLLKTYDDKEIEIAISGKSKPIHINSNGIIMSMFL